MTPGKHPHTIACEKYVDADGNPTCALSFAPKAYGKRAVCIFYYTAICGTEERCHAAKTYLMRRRSHGSLIPAEECPIWREEK